MKSFIRNTTFDQKPENKMLATAKCNAITSEIQKERDTSDDLTKTSKYQREKSNPITDECACGSTKEQVKESHRNTKSEKKNNK